MKPPLWRVSASVTLDRPAYNEGDYAYQERDVPALSERYVFAFDAADADYAIANLLRILSALRTEAGK